jgi:LysM repeat protein
MRHFIYFYFLSMTLFAGCATEHPVYPPPQVPVSIEPGIYIAQPGDTALTIAARFHLTIKQLSSLNSEMAISHMKIGQKIRVSSN